MKNLVILSAACGVGKSTIKDALAKSNLLNNYVFVDTDEVGINWWDYAGTNKESKFNDDCLAEAIRISNGKNLFFVTCMNPKDFYDKVNIPRNVISTYLIGMTCSDEEIIKRLKARPKERLCGSNEFIAKQIQYNNWFKKNAGKFQLHIDNTNKTVEETAQEIAVFIKNVYHSF